MIKTERLLLNLGMRLRQPQPRCVWEWAVALVMKHWETKVECVVLEQEGLQDCPAGGRLALGYKGGGRVFCKEARSN